jgi:hypothetical protein
MDRIEHELAFEELVVLRRIAMNKAEKEIELHKVLYNLQRYIKVCCFY